MTERDKFVQAADEELQGQYEPPMTLDEYVETIFEDPKKASHSSKYLLEAIEAAGTRTVVEEGEQKDRYRFFDDPYNDNEHAILGNTEVINQFVDDLRAIAARQGKDEKILWIDGPTATGKSEMKRCLVNGLNAYSKTEEGRRYTIELNVAGVDSGSPMTYGDGGSSTDEDDWYTSPVQSHPLSVFPEAVRYDLLEELNEQTDDPIPIDIHTDLDPFSRESYEYLEEVYRRKGEEDLFSAITDEQHLRVKNYVVDVGDGIGILHSEDEGKPKQRLVGSWMRGMLQKLDSQGRKDARAFSYDGVLSQGNGLLTIVEDASQHTDLLQKLLNVPDEEQIKLDKGIGMDIDTQMLIISNPDLEAQLNQHAEREGTDPLKALKRRLDKRSFNYLTEISAEANVLYRELANDSNPLWMAESYDALEEEIQRSRSFSVKDEDNVIHEKELAPHTLEAAAVYNIVSRLDSEDLPPGLDLIDKAILYDKGFITDGDELRYMDEFDFEPSSVDGETGIPVTYARDIIADLLHSEQDRYHPNLDVEHVIMPNDVLDAMADNLTEEPVFSDSERTEFENRLVPVKNHISQQQEQDVLDAIMRDEYVSEEAIEGYIEKVQAWVEDDQIKNDRGELEDPDPLEMKVFETEQLGRFDDGDYDGTDPTEPVREFREDKLMTSLNRHAWENRDGEFNVTDIPVLETVIENYDWDSVRNTFEDLDPKQWENPPSDTETLEVKEHTIENMVDMFGYSEASAELTSRNVMDQVSYRWD